jgi:hypothetical protein
MWSSWWFVWMIVMVLFLLPPVGYGWGYRGWGAPYPRYIQRRRSAQAALANRAVAVDHQSWGWAGDYVWGMLFIGTIWIVAAFFWTR